MFRSLVRQRIPLGGAGTPEERQGTGPRVLAIVAHPDDEYVFAATVWRIVRELDGAVDQLVITDGAGGHRYAGPARHIYGVQLDGDDAASRAWLTAIRREETRAAAEILGLRRQFFLDQPDTGFTLDADQTVHELWDQAAITQAVGRLLDRESYDFVFLLLPSTDTHGHHQAAAVLALDCIARLPDDRRPVVLGVEAAKPGTARRYTCHPRYPITRAVAGAPVWDVDRREPLEGLPGVSHHVVVNWVISEHKSQGLFQAEANRCDIERFRVFAAGHARSRQRAGELFRALSGRAAVRRTAPAAADHVSA